MFRVVLLRPVHWTNRTGDRFSGYDARNTRGNGTGQVQSKRRASNILKRDENNFHILFAMNVSGSRNNIILLLLFYNIRNNR